MQKTSSTKRIVIVAMPDTLLLDVAGPADVFSRVNKLLKTKSVEGGYELIVASPDSSTVVSSASGIGFSCNATFDSIKEGIDTLLIAGFSANQQKISDELTQWLKDQAKTVRRLGSICRGAFVLAAAGFLKGRKATTHWMYCEDLQKQYPEILVNPDPIFIKDGNIYTSAGVSSGMDLALALVEEDFGRDIALAVARQLVLYLRRPGNQSQFSVLLANQEPELEPIRDLQRWILDHLDKELTVEQLAEKSSMSPRNFTRVFQRETGMTPGKYIEKLRVETARRRLEETHLSLEQIAAECGIGSADSMRRLFLRHLKVTPSDYRRSFQTALEMEIPSFNF